MLGSDLTPMLYAHRVKGVHWFALRKLRSRRQHLLKVIDFKRSSRCKNIRKVEILGCSDCRSNMIRAVDILWLRTPESLLLFRFTQ